MRPKTFAILLSLILLATAAGPALAQGGGGPELLPKSAFMRPGAAPARQPEAGPSLASPIVNGGFDQGPNIGWTESSIQDWAVVTAAGDLPVPTHSGSWSAWLGGADLEQAYVTQTVSVPASASLRLFYWTASAGACGLLDKVQVRVKEPAASGFTNLYTWDMCFANNSQGWKPLDLSLGAYGGKTIELRIEISTNAADNSNFFLDDVSMYGTFADVPYGYWAEDFVVRLYNAGITGGCGTGPLLYCPEGTVTRGQMAVFLLRGIHGSSYAPPPVGSSTGFNDVAPSYWSAAFIKQLAAEGITAGCGSGNYCPEAPVNRAQMAIFLLRAKHGSAYTPPPVGAGTGFTDVPASYWAAAWIKQLVAEGITVGCGGNNYCPEAPVNRAQMAVFLVRTFGLP